MIAVSACLLGVCCRYDGGARLNRELAAMLERGEVIPICPECMGGLPTPREPCELIGGDGGAALDGKARVVTRGGRDVTNAFISGAEAALRAVMERGATECVLKAGSPSCGCGEIYDGSFTGRKIPGDGVAAALFKRSGIPVRAGEALE